MGNDLQKKYGLPTAIALVVGIVIGLLYDVSMSGPDGLYPLFFLAFGLLAGALAGFINGFFGAGGGMVLVPLLLWLVRLEDKAAFSSAVAVILPLCAVSIAVYAVHDSLPLWDALPYLIGGAAGGVLAGLWFRKIPAKALHLILGGVILAGGVRLIVC